MAELHLKIIECKYPNTVQESKIEQCKLLGIKTSMTYDAIHSNNNNNMGRNKSKGKNQGCSQSQSSIRNCKYCGKSHDRGSCPAFGKECSKCGKKNHFKAVCKSGSGDKQDQSRSRPKKGRKGKKFHEINESEDNGMDDLADQVQSLFYHDVHFNNVNTRTHTELGCEMSQNRSKQVFKIHWCRWKFDGHYHVHEIVPKD